MFKNKFKKLLVIASPAVLSVSLVACAATVNSDNKNIQDKILLQHGEKVSNNEYLNSILTYQYREILGSDSVDQALENANSTFFNEAWEAFDFYQSQQLQNDPFFFIKLINAWSSQGFLSQDGTPDSNINATQQLNVESNQPLNKMQLVLISKNLDTGIKELLKKMLITKQYLLNSTKENIEKSKEYTENKDKDEYKYISTDSKDFFLLAQVLKNRILQKWEFNTDKLSALASYGSFKIKDGSGFNLLSENKLSLVRQKVVPQNALQTSDDLNTNQLFSYKGLQINQTGNADLNFAVSYLRSQDTTKSGFVDNNTSKIYSQRQLTNAAFWKGKKTAIPKLNDSAKSKNRFEIKVTDFTFEDQSDLNFEVVGIYPDETRERTLEIIINATDKNNQQNNFVYRVKVVWFTEADKATQYTPSNGKEINIPSELNVLTSDKKQVQMAYVNKITPLATFVKVSEDKKTANIYFSFEKTPWNTDLQKTKLAFSLYNINDSFYNAAVEFYKSLGFELEKKYPDIAK
ncbi:HinT-interacting membrane complex lipoprotein P60 [Candidatus Mycoplasma pogonae]